MSNHILKTIIEKYSKEEVEKIYNDLKSLKKVGDYLNCSPQTIRRLLYHYDIKVNPSLGNKRHFFNEKYFEKIDIEHKTYWLGFIYSDGCVYQGTGTTNRLQINLKYSDIEHLNKFQKDLGSDYKIQIKEVNGHKSCLLKVNSTPLCNDLISHGVSYRKSLNLKMPNIPDKLIRHFIRGYFDGDGSITFSINNRLTKSFSICGCGYIMNDLANILDISINIKTRNRNTPITVIFTAEKDKIIRIYEYLYKDSTIYLQRKYRNYSLIYDILKLCPTIQ